jgi:UDP-GlcNAc:undecaprenyl-phosphate GlcNAc-1-phosphate transferase
LPLIFTLGAVSLVLCLVLTPIVRDVIGKFLVDHPDGQRKKHAGPVPRVGGIAIALSCLTTFGIVLALPTAYGQVLRDALPDIWKIGIGASVVFLTGVLDDLLGLNAWKKLAGICAAGVLAYAAGTRVDLHQFPALAAYPWIGFVVTVVWLVGCTNAFNLIDGMDGLAAGVGLFAGSAMLVAALVQGNWALALATMPLVGCLIGFLRYNFNPASVFLGDSGSLLIGFLLACYGAVWSQKSVTLVALLAPVLAVSLPLLDVSVSVLRRFLRNRPIFQGDRGHIHHKLLERGFTPTGAVLVMYGVCFFAAASSLLVGAFHNRFSALIVILFCIPAGIGIQYLGYAEFVKAGRLILKGGFRQIIDAETRLHEFEQSLMTAGDLNECWNRITEGTREFGFQGVRMRVGGMVLEDWTGWNAKPLWQLRIPLPGAQYVNFFRDFDEHVDPLILSAFVNCVERGMKENAAYNEPLVEHAAGAVPLVRRASCAADSEAVN